MTLLANKTCFRCGNCCIDVGRTFWKGGNLNFPHLFGDNDYLNKRANDGDYEDNGLPCEMHCVENGLSTCIIERDFGPGYKPIVCVEHQGDKRCKQRKAGEL